MNNSLLNILDTQCKVQQETTQALSTIIRLQDTRANDAFLTDLPTFCGNPEEFLDWILKVEKVAALTGRSEIELATAKADGAVFKCLNKMKPSTNWEDCKKILRENFSNLQSKTHAQSYLINRAQRSNETLQEYVHLFAELAKTITGTDARHNTKNLYVTLFNRHLYNRHIKKHVSKREHVSLQSAFDAAYATEAEAKKFAGLNDTVSIAIIEAEADVNYVQAGTTRLSTQQDGLNKRQSYNQGKPKGPCYSCFEYGHLAYECPGKDSSSSAQPKSSDHLNHVQLVASEQPPKVTRSIITDSQLSVLLTKMQEMHAENRKMKDFMKQKLPFLQGGKPTSN